jgi:S-layer protein
MATADTIKQYFVNILQRDPTAAETSYWVATVDSGALTTTQARDAIAASGESVTYVDQIIRIYQAAFGRVPDTTGIDGWTDQLRADATALSKVAAGFVNSTEWKNRYGDNTVNDAVLQALYQNVLGRTGSAAEIAAWKATGQSMTQILIGFSNSAEFQASSAAGVMALKRAAGDVTTANLATVFNGTSPLGVDYGSTNYTLTTGVDNYVGNNGTDKITGILDGAATTTYNPLDTIDGGAGNDTVTLTNSAGTLALNAAAGGTVKNVENLVLRSGANAVTADVQAWAGLENVTVEQLGTKAAIDIDTKGNVKSVTVTGGTTVAIDDNGAAGADKIATVSLDGNTGAATITSDVLTKLTVANTNQNVTITAAAATRALDLTLNNVTGGTITDAEATSLKVTGSGTASTGATLTAAKATKIDVAGDKAVSVALGAQAAGLVITSTNSAGTTITNTLNNDVTFTGGAGKDSIIIGATTKAITTGTGDDTVDITVAALGSGGSVTAGDGTDTVILAAADAYTASGATTFAGVVKGFEVLQIGATAGAGEIKVNNLNNAGNNAITKVVAGGVVGHAVTISGLASGNTVEFKAANTAATTATVTNAAVGTTDVLNIGITNVAGINVNTINAADVETVNFLTDDTATTPTGIQHTATLVDTAAKTITVTGDAGLALTFAGTALTSFDASGVTKGNVSYTSGALAAAATLKGGAGNDTIDASAATKAVTIDGGAGNDTITGSATASTLNGGDGNDTITGGAGADTITGGAGNDTINSGAGLDTVDVGAGDDTFVVTANANGNVYASLTGMGKGDKVDFLAGGGAATFTTAKITLADTAAFADYLQAAAAGGADRVVWFQWSGNTYLVQDVTAGATFTNGADQVVKLVGLVDLSTATIDGAASNVLTLG